MTQRYFQLYKPLHESEDLRHEFQFLVLNIYNEGNLGSRTLTCSSVIPLPKDTRQSISDNFLLTACSATQTSFKI